MTGVHVPDEQQAIRAEIVRIGASLFQRGYAHSTAGNISVRLTDTEGGGFLITPTDACLGFLNPDDLAWVDPAGVPKAGLRASKTLALHRRIYQQIAGARCVIHTHSSHLVALTLQGVWSTHDILPPITPYQVMKVGHVPLIPYAAPGDSSVADAVARQLECTSTLRAVMLDRLGPVVWHDCPAQAMALLEELEESARLWLMCNPRPESLTNGQIAELRARFNAPW